MLPRLGEAFIIIGEDHLEGAVGSDLIPLLEARGPSGLTVQGVGLGLGVGGSGGRIGPSDHIPMIPPGPGRFGYTGPPLALAPHRESR